MIKCKSTKPEVIDLSGADKAKFKPSKKVRTKKSQREKGDS